MSEELKVTPEDARDIVFEDHPDFEVIKRNIADTSRWSIIWEVVVRHIPTDKYYFTSYSVGATECQEERPFENDDEVVLKRVFKKEKVVTVYE